MLFQICSVILYKFEKEKKSIELHLAGKLEIAKEVYMRFRDISKIIKENDRMTRLESNWVNNIYHQIEIY